MLQLEPSKVDVQNSSVFMIQQCCCKVKWQVTMSDCTRDRNGLFISPDYCVLWEKFATRACLIFYNDNFYDDNRLLSHINEGCEVTARGVQRFASKYDGFDPLFLFIIPLFLVSKPENNGTSVVEKRQIKKKKAGEL